jgi:hypothetical protein
MTGPESSQVKSPVLKLNSPALYQVSGSDSSASTLHQRSCVSKIHYPILPRKNLSSFTIALRIVIHFVEYLSLTPFVLDIASRRTHVRESATNLDLSWPMIF